ncbi:hypothetical protein LXA43DRAFT_1104462 [Ganoderma leucocontextum]|nr:hypothetical protein LXA43DRAFT_1104462 [Ganoderma leucocontextum]
MECTSCNQIISTHDVRPILLTCGHVCCESCIGRESLISDCKECKQLVVVATRLFVDVVSTFAEPNTADLATETENQTVTSPGEMRGPEAEARMSTAIQALRRFTEENLSPGFQGSLRQQNQANRHRVAAKMSSYFQLRQHNMHLQKQNKDTLDDIERGQHLVKETKRQLSRESAALEKTQLSAYSDVCDMFEGQPAEGRGYRRMFNVPKDRSVRKQGQRLAHNL